METKNVFVGFEYSLKSNWQEILGDPKKPGNWGQEAYEKKLPEMRAKQAAGASRSLAAGQISRACIIEHCVSGPKVIKSGIVGAEVLEALYQIVGTSASATEMVVFGLETLDSLRICGWNAAPEHSADFAWNSGLDTNVDLVNLYSCSGAKGASMSIEDMLKYWVPDMAANAIDVLNVEDADESMRVAAAVYTMSKNMGLF